MSQNGRNMILLMRRAHKYLEQWKHTGFICPVCGGIASVILKGEVIEAECHACSTRAKEDPNYE